MKVWSLIFAGLIVYTWLVIQLRDGLHQRVCVANPTLARSVCLTTSLQDGAYVPHQQVYAITDRNGRIVDIRP